MRALSKFVQVLPRLQPFCISAAMSAEISRPTEFADISKITWSKFSYKLTDLVNDPHIPLQVPSQAALVQLHLTDSILPFASASSILDIACGPGTVYSTLLDSSITLNPNAPLLGNDISPSMIANLHETIASHPNDPRWTRVHAIVEDATSMTSIPSSSQSHVLSALGICNIPSSDAALLEVRRVMAPCGVFSMTSIAKAAWMTDVMGILGNFYPTRAVPFTSAKWRTKEGFAAELERNGFVDVLVEEAELRMGFASPEEIVETLWRVLPFIPSLTEGMRRDEIEGVKDAQVRFVRETYPDGILPGMALVGVAR